MGAEIWPLCSSLWRQTQWSPVILIYCKCCPNICDPSPNKYGVYGSFPSTEDNLNCTDQLELLIKPCLVLHILVTDIWKYDFFIIFNLWSDGCSAALLKTISWYFSLDIVCAGSHCLACADYTNNVNLSQKPTHISRAEKSPGHPVFFFMGTLHASFITFDGGLRQQENGQKRFQKSLNHNKS